MPPEPVPRRQTGALREHRHVYPRLKSWSVVARRDNEPLLVRIQHVCQDGIDLLCGKPLPKGTHLVVSLEGPDATISRRSARVIRNQSHGVGWIVGCAFDRTLSADELQALTLPAES
jgi:hypothetical protein